MSRDVIWINKNYGSWKGLTSTSTTLIPIDDDDDDDEAAVTADRTIIDASNDTAIQDKAIRELRKLQFTSGGGNPTADIELNRLSTQNQETGREMAEAATDVLDFSLIAKDTLLKTVKPEKKNNEPKGFKEAYFHQDPVQRENWRKAIKKEFHDMNQRGVWRHRKRSEIPGDRRCVKCKWVFKIKRNGVYRARLVACGYTQIPGVDFTDAFSPVIHDTTWRILLICKLLWGLHACLIDVETAFLHGDLTNDIYMDCPEGMTGVNNAVDCLELLKCIYGLVQAAR